MRKYVKTANGVEQSILGRSGWRQHNEDTRQERLQGARIRKAPRERICGSSLLILNSERGLTWCKQAFCACQGHLAVRFLMLKSCIH